MELEQKAIADTKQINNLVRSTRTEYVESDRTAQQRRVVMFYDGACPLCGREVTHYRRLDKANRVLWVDINIHPGVLDAAGIGYNEAMSRLHVIDGAGVMHTGAAAFAAIWDQLPYYRWLARVVRALRLLPTIETVYSGFARWRLRRRGCTSASCGSR